MFKANSVEEAQSEISITDLVSESGISTDPRENEAQSKALKKILRVDPVSHQLKDSLSLLLSLFRISKDRSLLDKRLCLNESCVKMAHSVVNYASEQKLELVKVDNNQSTICSHCN
jgi:hypothetical protein